MKAIRGLTKEIFDTSKWQAFVPPVSHHQPPLERLTVHKAPPKIETDENNPGTALWPPSCYLEQNVPRKRMVTQVFRLIVHYKILNLTVKLAHLFFRREWRES